MSCIYLRPISENDTGNIVKWRNNSRVKNNFLYRETFTEAIHETWMREVVAKGKAVQFIICEKKDNRPVGSVFFRDINYQTGEAEYGIFIGEEDAWGKGYGSEAATKAVIYGFQCMAMNRLMLRVFTDNTAAIKSYKKVGFVIVETVMQVKSSDGECKDMYHMELQKQLRNEERYE